MEAVAHAKRHALVIVVFLSMMMSTTARKTRGTCSSSGRILNREAASRKKTR